MKTRLALAYIGVILIWTTTPLAIKWSSIGVSFVFGAMARMTTGLVCLSLLLLLLRQPLPRHRAALLSYLAVAVQLYGSMLVTYWSAQFVPSGWISVIFGLSPFLTAFMAAAYLKERSLGWGKLCAYSLGVCGLVVMFSSALELAEPALQGLLGVLLATFIHAASAVWVKQIHAQLSALQLVTGGLLLAVPLYFLTWYWLDEGVFPAKIPLRAMYSIAYLGVIATTIGFALYYFVLNNMEATNVAMMNLMTPLMSLGLGYSVNHEPMTVKTMLGTALIMCALLIYEVVNRRQQRNGI